MSPQSSRSSPSSVAVVGGGLAGIAAAVRLAEHGLRVTLIETRQRLGGRATSFVDPATRQVLDNCQHVLLGCCTNLLDLYGRLGVRERIAWHRKLYFLDAAGNLDTLEADDLPAPLHMTRGLMAFRSLTLGEKIAISRGMLAMMRISPAQRDALNAVSFRQWLDDHGQPEGAIEKFWANIVISAINELPERMGANHAIHVFQDGFLANEEAYVMGLPAVPLVELYDAAETVLRRAGGEMLLSTSALGFTFDGGRVTGLRVDGGRVITADAFVSAVPFDRLAKLCDASMPHADARLRRLDEFGVSPIIGIHLVFESDPAHPVMSLPHLILTQSPLQWIFNKGPDGQSGGQHLHGVISAAHSLVDQPADALTEMAVREVRRALGGPAKGARLLHARVVKEKRATFSARPGLDAIRPTAHGAIPNLYLAGDWCKTGWPATMEGAARSGYLAAAALLEDLAPADPVTALVPDLPAGTLYRTIARV
ncbi:MAG: hydroxysqualene dehydroxylase HpnE [Planctomycetes bacterium]|nr:hydroxysqualene dehydroxylase HpnE [Planctomycetota bacterium]